MNLRGIYALSGDRGFRVYGPSSNTAHCFHAGTAVNTIDDTTMSGQASHDRTGFGALM
jgi:hypothetical protein